MTEATKTKTEEAEVPSTESSVAGVLEICDQRVASRARWLEGPVPASWDRSDEDWHSLVVIAREHLLGVAVTEVLEQIHLGWSLRELEANRLDLGSTLATDGTVRRPAPSLVSDFLLGRAIQLKNQLGARHLYASLDAALQIRLEHAQTETPDSLGAAIDAAEAVLARADAEKERRFAAEAGKLKVRITKACGRDDVRLEPADYWLQPEQLAALRSWWQVWQAANQYKSAKAYSECPFEVLE